MSYLKNIASGAVTDNLDPETTEYQKLISLRNAAGTSPLFEDVPQEIADAATSRIIAIATNGATIAADETTAGPTPEYSGTITAANFYPDADIVGVTTNTRTITAQQTAITGTSSPTRTVTTECTLAFTTGVNATAKTAKAMTINSAALAEGEPVEVVSAHGGTGIVDPGGIVVLTYTRT